jgi:SAM-dependent methyltransferase
LRLLGLVSTPQVQRTFFLDALGSLASDGRHSRVLISGTADYAMLAVLLAAYGRSKAEIDIVVVDICETPLILNRWYAGRQSAKVEAKAIDVLDFETQRPFDVICTHSFLVLLPRAKRRALVEKWRQLLRPGGALVTVSRVRPSATEAAVEFTPDQTDAFCRRVLAAARNRQDLVGVTPDELARHAQAYAQFYRSYPVASWTGLRDLFAEQGFKIDHFGEDPPGETASRGDSATLSTAGSDRTYAHIVCSRL